MKLADGLENEFIRLEPIDEVHRQKVLTPQLADAIWRWMPPLPKGTSMDSYYSFLLKQHDLGTVFSYVLFRKSDNAYAGIVGFDGIMKLHRRLRSAFAWHPPAISSPRLYGCGQLAMIELAYGWGANRIEWRVNTANQFITRNLEEIVAPKKEALLRNYERMADGNWADKAIFSLVRPEIKPTLDRMTNTLIEKTDAPNC